MKTRLLDGSITPAKSWDALMHKAITRARETGDARLKALETALSQGKSAALLKRLGIIGEADLAREFKKRT